ncbi:MAG TPA: hypothetical protein VKW06_05440 [Candidatus Angelobacter sp.]|nr:hypothetical protein [Candidatus Angelobacter sp.]
MHLFHRDDALRYSMLVVFSIACLLGAGLLWACLRPFLGSLDCLEQHKKAVLSA